MNGSWTFGRKIFAGFALSFVLLATIGLVAYRSVSQLTQTSYSVTHSHLVLEQIELVMSLLKDAETGQRGYVITGDPAFLEPYQASVTQVDKAVQDLRSLVSDAPAQGKLLDSAVPVVNAKLAELKQAIDLRRASGLDAAARLVQGGEGKRSMDDIRRILGQMQQAERDLLAQRAAQVESAAKTTYSTILIGTAIAALLVIVIGLAISRSLTSQVGAAVQHVQGSSSELQTAANQQATGAKEQATAMAEITTTINELLATSRQIAESAQRVAHIAEDTARSAQTGETTVMRTNEALDSVKRQVDLIVAHMLDLGKKSQQIGGILEIINELAEQTNILAINATIEAAGAGDAGRRFGVVADEIRKLADRVAGSSNEIRGLIDDIRAAVNATVMTTEGGTKAVETSGRNFFDVATSFRQIVTMVSTASEAAREIELSTKQQATAVEQVNSAITNVAQATRENEASSTQTFQTATELTRLSRDLSRLISPQAA